AGDHITSPVTIDSARLDDNLVTIRFLTSSNPGENYYLYILQPTGGQETLDNRSTLLDYSASPPRSVVERSLPLPAGATGARLVLRRLTRACHAYQVSLNEANSAQQGSITTPALLDGNINGALGLFTCYTEDALDMEAPSQTIFQE
ncbi:MAG: DUF4249 domain-containing protein, partial [Odoribacteraceae bacterium]|nr:DUF4249 domain-containing protein [Odoribacteraceae bacterium]